MTRLELVRQTVIISLTFIKKTLQFNNKHNLFENIFKYLQSWTNLVHEIVNE